MRIADVIGTVTLSKQHPSLVGGRWLVVTPLLATGLKGDDGGREEPVVAYDQLGASPGVLIALSEGAEASAPFAPEQKPLDAYCAAILDTIEVE